MFQLRPHQQRALDALAENTKGIVVFPTGGGKTNVAIYDAIRVFQSKTPMTVVVVAPRLSLISQLSREFMEHIDQHVEDVSVLQVSSGNFGWPSTTNPDLIDRWESTVMGHKIIFTTYKSLPRIVESGIHINTIYFDEAHNSVRSDYFESTEYMSYEADRCYFFTATPKVSESEDRPGMNEEYVYGKILCSIPAPELIDNGFIVPPKVKTVKIERSKNTDPTEAIRDDIVNAIRDLGLEKIMVCAKSTTAIISLMGTTDFMEVVQSQGFHVMFITSRHGAFIDGKKVSKEDFFSTLNAWGKETDRKFVVLHHSILGEGINVSGLEAVMFMRGMDTVGIGQTVGRTLRLDHRDAEAIASGEVSPGALEDYHKPYGMVVVPVSCKRTERAARSIEEVVSTVFDEGGIAVSVMK